MSARALAFVAAGACLGALAGACGPKQPSGPPVGVSDKPDVSGKARASLRSEPATFVFDSLDDRPVSSDATRGKPTVLAFVTTGGIVGQAQVDYLVAMAKRDKGAINYALVAMHPRRELVLVEAYADALGVEFPVALADPSRMMDPDGPLGEIPAVPTVVILDRLGRIVWKHTGLAKSDELRAHLAGL